MGRIDDMRRKAEAHLAANSTVPEYSGPRPWEDKPAPTLGTMGQSFTPSVPPVGSAPPQTIPGSGGQLTSAAAAVTPQSITEQTASARAAGAAAGAAGQSAYEQQQQTASGYQGAGQGYQVTAGNVASGGGYTTPAQGGAAPQGGGYNGPAPVFGQGGGGNTSLFGPTTGGQSPQGQPAQQAPSGPGFNIGYQQQAQQYAAPGMVDPSQLGNVSGVMSQLGGGPANVAGQLGQGYQVGNVGDIAGQLGQGYQVGNVANVAGQLGQGYQVGDVGDIQMGAAPGNVAGQLGNMGQSSGAQQGMLGRLEGFLDTPDGPSIAQAQLQQSQADNMASLIGAARSGRGGAGAQAQALRGAISEGGAIASDTVGQMATLRAQEEDMLRNRQLNAIGMGGQLTTNMRGQDLSYRGQDLSALQGDQSTQLGARGQDLTGAMANQSTQSALEQLRANTAVNTRGQDLSALQGDQGTQLGLEQTRANTAVNTRGQDLSALTADQATQLGLQDIGARTATTTRQQDLSALQGDQTSAVDVRGQNVQGLSADQLAQVNMRNQNLGALQGNQTTQSNTRGQDINQETSLAATNAQLRGQDANVMTADADRQLNAQDLALQGQLGFGGLANDATATGLQALGQSQNQQLIGEGMAQDAQNNLRSNQTSIANTNTMADAAIVQQQNALNAAPEPWEQALYGALGSVAGGAGYGIGKGAVA